MCIRDSRESAKIAVAFLCNAVVGVDTVYTENKHKSRGLESLPLCHSIDTTHWRTRKILKTQTKRKTEQDFDDGQTTAYNRCFLSETNIFKTDRGKNPHNKHLLVITCVNIQSGDTC